MYRNVFVRNSRIYWRPIGIKPVSYTHLTFVKRVGTFDNRLVKQEVVGLCKKMVQEHPEIGAILLECTDMPPYAADVQRELNLPVFDPITMINFVHSAVARKPFYGFM